MVTVGNQPDDQRDGAPTFLPSLGKQPKAPRSRVVVVNVHVISAPITLVRVTNSFPVVLLFQTTVVRSGISQK